MKLTQAQIDRLRSLETAKGEITPDEVVIDAQRKDSPLHPLFDWDEKAAAQKWWTHRAREIINSVTILVTTNEFTYKAPAYVVDTSVKGQGYRSTVALSADADSARESLVYTLETAAGHLRRALDLAVPLGLSNEIDRLLEEVAGVQRTIKKAA